MTNALVLTMFGTFSRFVKFESCYSVEGAYAES